MPTLTSSTTVTNNVIQSPASPNAQAPIGINFLNSINITASGNIIYDLDSSVTNATSGLYAQTEAIDGKIVYLTTTNAGTGGTQGTYAIAGGGPPCTGGNFTGGHGSPPMSTFAMLIGAGGTITGDLTFVEPYNLAGSNYQLGDLLTPVANFPSINTTGTSLTATGSGGTLGSYGASFGLCPRDSTIPVSGDTVEGVALTNFSGSMAGTGALAAINLNSFSSITRALGSGSTYHATGTTTNAQVIAQEFGGIGTTKITVSGAVPSAYNGTWTIDPGGSTPTTLTWDLGTMVDPGPVTTPGTVMAYGIVSTGIGYVAGDVLTVPSGNVGGQTGIRITVGTVAHLSGWTVTVTGVETAGVHGLTFTSNIIFNWPGTGPPAAGDGGGINDGGGAANTWTGNSNCASSQFTGTIAGTTLTSSAVVNGPIAAGNLAGPGVTAGSTIVSGGPTSWVISPSQTVSSPVTMYSYICTPTKVYTAPYRTVQTYAASRSLTATIDGYHYGNGTPTVNGTTGAMNNAKWNWDPLLTANNGLNPYIRLGFQ
jgi:hypothetical protein